ncbi:hypothetical protein MNBD_BACTEROID05-242 [hydrothermal vent metagenome]|uniref:Uncharacterized protein n=1 Tax=hydrothermal vent metagenome TaxID=652676 RepID=A0A3B0UCW4_9ZZZZ
MELLTAILDVVGSVFIVYMALRVHNRVLAKYQIDEKGII